jgi:hypothetical protein
VKTDRHEERKVIKKTFVKSVRSDLAGPQCCSNNDLPFFVSTESSSLYAFLIRSAVDLITSSVSDANDFSRLSQLDRCYFSKNCY